MLRKGDPVVNLTDPQQRLGVVVAVTGRRMEVYDGKPTETVEFCSVAVLVDGHRIVQHNVPAGNLRLAEQAEIDAAEIPEID